MTQKARFSRLERGERFKDARLEYNRNGRQTLRAVYDATGISTSLIQELEDDSSSRDIGYLKIQKLAEHYGVSIDWLLGLSDVVTVSPEMSVACEITGLSETAVKNIQRETATDSTRLALEVILCSDSEKLHALCNTVYKAVAGYFPNRPKEPLLECLNPELKQEVSEILSRWDGIILDPREAMQYNSFEAGNILSDIVDNSGDTAIRKHNEIFGQQLEIGGDYYGND